LRKRLRKRLRRALRKSNMSLHYDTQTELMLIGSKSGTTLTAVTLESTYQSESATVATKTFDTGLMSRIEFLIKYTMGATETTNSIEIKLEGTNDGTNFYQTMNDSTSGGTSTLSVREFTYVGVNAAAVNVNIGIDIAYSKMRIAIKETGVASNKGTVSVDALISGR